MLKLGISNLSPFGQTNRGWKTTKPWFGVGVGFNVSTSQNREIDDCIQVKRPLMHQRLEAQRPIVTCT